MSTSNISMKLKDTSIKIQNVVSQLKFKYQVFVTKYKYKYQVLVAKYKYQVLVAKYKYKYQVFLWILVLLLFTWKSTESTSTNTFVLPLLFWHFGKFKIGTRTTLVLEKKIYFAYWRIQNPKSNYIHIRKSIYLRFFRI